MNISDFDKQQMELVNQQACLLLEKGASDMAFFEALIDFVPDMKCLLEQVEEEELKLIIDSKQGLAHFLTVLKACS